MTGKRKVSFEEMVKQEIQDDTKQAMILIIKNKKDFSKRFYPQNFGELPRSCTDTTLR